MAGVWYGSRSQVHDLNGKPLIGARASFTLGGTTTPITVYQDSALTVPHPNPVISDGNGFFPAVFLDEADAFFNVLLSTKGGVTLYSDISIPIIGPTESGGGGTPTPVDPNALYKTGDIKMAFFDGVLVGFVRANARTIGTAVSGASERANSDCEQLYYHCWNNASDAVCPVLGGRGGSATADWAANKPLTLPDGRGAALIGLDTMGNIAGGRVPEAATLGWFGGAENVTLTTDTIPNHGHPLSDPGHFHTEGGARISLINAPGSGIGVLYGGGGSPVLTDPNTTGITLGTTGGGLPHANMQPSFAISIYLKL